jgi:hypothetical protein
MSAPQPRYKRSGGERVAAPPAVWPRGLAAVAADLRKSVHGGWAVQEGRRVEFIRGDDLRKYVAANMNRLVALAESAEPGVTSELSLTAEASSIADRLCTLLLRQRFFEASERILKTGERGEHAERVGAQAAAKKSASGGAAVAAASAGAAAAASGGGESGGGGGVKLKLRRFPKRLVSAPPAQQLTFSKDLFYTWIFEVRALSAPPYPLTKLARRAQNSRRFSARFCSRSLSSSSFAFRFGRLQAR